MSCTKPGVRVIPAQPIDSKTSNEEKETLRRACGCVRTSDKLKNILKMFPQAPPPSPNKDLIHVNYMQHYDPGELPARLCNHKIYSQPMPAYFIHDLAEIKDPSSKVDETPADEHFKCQHLSKSWIIITELVSLLQLSVTATALVIYYIIFCYMQLIYCVLRSVVFFHHADVPMKITISIVTITGLVIGLNFITRMENLVGIHFRKYI